MTQDYLERQRRLVERIAESAPSGMRSAVRAFYAKAPITELERLPVDTAVAVAISAHKFLSGWKAGEASIRIFQPNMETHGYASHHPVIEIANDDMPFLVDSVTMELGQLGLTLHRMLHPLLQTPTGTVSLMHAEFTAMPEGLTTMRLTERLHEVLASVRAATGDWKRMAERAASATETLERSRGDDAHEAAAFLEWLREKNFIFLGTAVGNERLGLCAMDAQFVPEGEPEGAISISKSAHRSPVHRAALLDVVSVRTGKREVQHFVGLFTSSVYYQSLEQIPLARRTLERVMARSGFEPSSHDGKALKTILEFHPRDEVLQTSEEALFDLAMGIFALEARPAVRLFVRQDAAHRFASCMVFVPREHFSTELRKTITSTLAAALGGTLESFTTQLSDSPLARLQVLIRTAGTPPAMTVEELEAEIARYTHLWSDQLREALVARVGEEEADRRHHAFAHAFPQGYRERYSIAATLFDIEQCRAALASGELRVDFFRHRGDAEGVLRLKTYNPGDEIALSDILPVLESMGLRAIDETPWRVTPQGTHPLWVRDFTLALAEPQTLDWQALKPLLEETLLTVWRGEAENDRFNALTLRAHLPLKRVVLLRAYARYLRQVGFAYSQSIIAQALIRYPVLAAELVALFDARFDPAHTTREEAMAACDARILEQLSAVESLTDDRVLRQYRAVILATLRTNYYQPARPVLSFKLRSADVPGLPLPVPHVEIFVYAVRVEGIHLRGGKVARGGIRWSDRMEDFRTEVLGLMKAQMVKNSVIVPVGSKGGFVVKKPPREGGREATQQEGVACYKLYLGGLLDVTDNLQEQQVQPPPFLVRHDGDDPYLVVAADKGTATFSDIANNISRERGFWLDDAFASGGSAGYDHKKMGITARGGWVSVTRHFHEMGVNIATQEFTCVGIGDMAGDVFGNGMLLADTMKLVAAFNHQHIFIDPAPNPKKSFAERQRLFHLPRSTWRDYNDKLISKGGGVFERTAKTIRLSAEARAALSIEQEEMTPDELIRAILSAPVDLLWNGGIGTYVKASTETHDQVGDRTNDALRVNGAELRCKVVGEGGNLGFTQRGRVEYALAGGRINTDAIDNSGGVDCSDHEVNIKIAFSTPLRAGTLTRDARDQLLATMTDEVAALVLRDNYLQTQALSVAERQGAALLDSEARLMQRLESTGLLNRAIEFLPTPAQLEERRSTGRSLTRPERAVLLAYAKIALFNEIIASALPDEPYFASDLMRYFPRAMQQQFADAITQHRLKREIIATVATNSLVNRMGATFYFDIAEETGAPVRDVVAAYTLARDAFDMRALWQRMDDAAATTDAGAHLDMLIAGARVLAHTTRWALRNLPAPLTLESVTPALAEAVRACRPAADTLEATVAALEPLSATGDAWLIAKSTGAPVADVARTYLALGERLHLPWLRQQAESASARSHWDRLALQALVQDLFDEQRRICLSALEAHPTGDTLAQWSTQHTDLLVRHDAMVEDLRTRGQAGLSALLVTLRQLRGL